MDKTKNKENKTSVFYITYEDGNRNQWTSKKGFYDIEDAKVELREEGFYLTQKGWERESKGWSLPMKAYIQSLTLN